MMDSFHFLQFVPCRKDWRIFVQSVGDGVH
jgi:hypothetical protein